MIGRFSEPFLSQRQRSLEKFLTRVASHNILRANSCLKIFLEKESLENIKETMVQSNKKQDQSFWQWATAASASIGTKVWIFRSTL